MRKNFYLSGLFLCILALCGCGGGGSAADPMGTGTVQFVDESGSVITSATVSPGGSITLLAKVTNLRSDGTAVPVVNEKVSFSLISFGNGGGVSVVNDRTASGGQAMAVYTAGNNMASDTVRVTTDGSGSTATITITKTGGIVGARIATLSPSSSAVAAGQTSVITAHVTDGNSNPMWGETVTFTIPVNESGASFVYAAGVYVSSVSVNTDAAGNAIAVYYAGSNDSLTVVYDTVRGALTNGSSNAVVITRSAETPPTDLSISVAAAPTPVSAGQVSIVTATLTGDDNAGVTVTFSLPVNNSGASLSASYAVTDGSGKAVVTYTAGSSNPTQTVTDTVRASVGSISDSAAITRTGTGTTSYTVTLTPPGDFTGGWTGQIVAGTLTAKVVDNLGKNVAGVTVTFTIESASVGAKGTLSSATAVTNAGGEAAVSYSRNVVEAAGITIFINFKATIPDGTSGLGRLQIDA